jgi:hypothetical protein
VTVGAPRLLYVDEAVPVLHKAGFGVLEMAAMLDCSRETIRTRLRELGVPPYPPRRERIARPRRTIPPGVRARIRAEHERGLNPSAIADLLNAERVPTARGGRKWYRGTIVKALVA